MRLNFQNFSLITQVVKAHRGYASLRPHYEEAKRWSVDAERQIGRGETPTDSRVGKLKALSLHISDMKAVGKAPG